eukprot:scaffold114414_cov45-Tisochrysis_lutea.AAC.1
MYTDIWVGASNPTAAGRHSQPSVPSIVPLPQWIVDDIHAPCARARRGALPIRPCFAGIILRLMSISAAMPRAFHLHQRARPRYTHT